MLVKKIIGIYAYIELLFGTKSIHGAGVNQHITIDCESTLDRHQWLGQRLRGLLVGIAKVRGDGQHTSRYVKVLRRGTGERPLG